MAEPTKEQIQWLWEQYGFRYEETTKQVCGKVSKCYMWRYPDGFWYEHLPPIDLNNLFKYEPLTARGYHITTDTYKREVAGTMGQCSWAKIIDPNGNIVSCFAMKELKDALFWAIFTALGGVE